MKKWVPFIAVTVTYMSQFNGPQCRHIQVCDEPLTRCVLGQLLIDDLLMPINEDDDPLLSEAKILLREKQKGDAKTFTEKEVKDFFEAKPDFGAIDTVTVP